MTIYNSSFADGYTTTALGQIFKRSEPLPIVTGDGTNISPGLLPLVANAPADLPAVPVRKNGVPTDWDMQYIRRLAQNPDGLKPENLYSFECCPSTQRIDSLLTAMDVTSLQNYALDAFGGVAVMNSHRTGLSSPATLPVGRSYYGTVQPDPNYLNAKRFIAISYMLRNNRASGDNTDDIIQAVEAGTVFDVSIGFRFTPGTPEKNYLDRSYYRCSICDCDWVRGVPTTTPLMEGKTQARWFGMDDTPEDEPTRCNHFPGERYDGNMCFLWVVNARLAEFSFVYSGATDAAIVLKARKAAENRQLSEAQIRHLETIYNARIGNAKAIAIPDTVRADGNGVAELVATNKALIDMLTKGVPGMASNNPYATENFEETLRGDRKQPNMVADTVGSGEHEPDVKETSSSDNMPDVKNKGGQAMKMSSVKSDGTMSKSGKPDNLDPKDMNADGKPADKDDGMYPMQKADKPDDAMDDDKDKDGDGMMKGEKKSRADKMKGDDSAEDAKGNHPEPDGDEDENGKEPAKGMEKSKRTSRTDFDQITHDYVALQRDYRTAQDNLNRLQADHAKAVTTIQTLKARIATSEDEVERLRSKSQEMRPFAEVGYRYRERLVSEITLYGVRGQIMAEDKINRMVANMDIDLLEDICQNYRQIAEQRFGPITLDGKPSVMDRANVSYVEGNQPNRQTVATDPNADYVTTNRQMSEALDSWGSEPTVNEQSGGQSNGLWWGGESRKDVGLASLLPDKQDDSGW